MPSAKGWADTSSNLTNINVVAWKINDIMDVRNPRGTSRITAVDLLAGLRFQCLETFPISNNLSMQKQHPYKDKYLIAHRSDQQLCRESQNFPGQDPIGLLGHLGTLMAPVELPVNQSPQVQRKPPVTEETTMQTKTLSCCYNLVYVPFSFQPQSVQNTKD
ncbi:hypothetical protein WISP_127470 [Willisornis vidua]|uniref:Uncharacterized protein n=1 Tax=Willisornis vidua TaxID=1566151 RepID=A0ABQ9CWL9_9PASS|nr:hypothetical protein WISP_127470 [Willisornis vidua]